MSEKYTMGVEVNINSQQQTSTAEVIQSTAPETRSDSPFCIAIMGDFSGRACVQSTADLPQQQLIEIDRDNLEEVMARLNIKLQLPLPSGKSMGENPNQQLIELTVSELDDFHPDELYDKLDSFAELRSLRRRLKNNNSFAEAAAEIQAWAGSDVSQAAVVVSDQLADQSADQSKDDAPLTENAEPVNPSDLLSNILDSQQGTPQQSTEAGQIDSLIRSIVAPYVEPKADPRQDEMMSILDRATEKHMQDILHNPVFQQIEAAWLSLYFLVRRLETGAKLKLFILDISQQELQDELAKEDISQSILYKRFCDPAEGDRPWSLLVGNYHFDDSVSDIQTLKRMGEIAQAANAPFISDASPHFAACTAFAQTPDYEDWHYTVPQEVNEAWAQLRESSVAKYIGLALPRFLLRLPYGKKGKEVEVFDFEEMPEVSDPVDNHENYLWGHAAILKAEILARGFLQNGWSMQPGEVHQVEKLPLHYYQDDGETVNKPAAEIYLTEKAGEKLTAQGLMPLWSVKNMDAIRSADFRSIYIDADKLKGRWE